ncbi:MAG TPA: AtpZ/AtpI family protein [Anaerolineales bacterium]|jgi:formate hydrogenlyase subunit 4
MSSTDEEEKNRARRALILTLVAVAGQVGCLTLAITFAALFLGLWLDNRFDSRPLITVILMIGSVPVTLVLMVWVVRKATARLTSGSSQKPN